MEGEKLALVCMAAGGTGDITFRWYRGALGLHLGARTQPALTADLEIPAVREGDAEAYYCAADNGYGPSLSGLVSIAVRSKCPCPSLPGARTRDPRFPGGREGGSAAPSDTLSDTPPSPSAPVSQPVLTFQAPGPPMVVGDVVQLHCEAGRGSPPIRYRFYREDVPLGNRSAPFGGGASLNLSLTSEHSGNYSCEADNGRGAQRSGVVPLHVTGTAQPSGRSWSRSLSQQPGRVSRASELIIQTRGLTTWH